MALLTSNEIRTLVENVEGPCVSIYMPAHPRAEIESKQDQIRLQNLIREAGERLVNLGNKPRIVRQILAPVEALLPDDEFWRHQREGLAIFASGNLFRRYRLPMVLDEMAVVGGRFFVKPLLPLLTADGQFYVLAISQKDFRLLQCTRYTACEIDIEDVPKAVIHLMEYEERERYKGMGFHPAEPSVTGRFAPIFHGQTMGAEHTKKEVLEHFQRVDRALSKMLAMEQSPLVLAAVDYYHPIYREANTYPYLLERGIQGNPDGVSCEELHRLGWAIAEAYFARRYEEKALRYREARGTPRASNEVQDIVPAAYNGRVNALFVSLASRIGGSFAPETGEVRIMPDGQAEAGDLLDLAAVHTLLNRGDVFAVRPEDVPDSKPAAAFFRY